MCTRNYWKSWDFGLQQPNPLEPEIFFGILHRRVLRHGVFNSLEELDRAIEAFIDHWNRREAHPFSWTFKGYPLQREAKAA